MMIMKGGVTAARGFMANGIRAGIKVSGRPDLALIYSEVPAVAAGAFTSNVFLASPVKISKAHLKNRLHQAIIVNSGNANCANGRTGDKDAIIMADCIASKMALAKEEVLVASTGVIGKRLPIEKIVRKAPLLVSGLSKDRGADFASAIMTTDTVSKESAVRVRIGRCVVTIGGACKGVGMIYPAIKTEKHATMLCFITTDAAISKSMLESALTEASSDSFNMISVDGDMSTNDSCFVLANGMANNRRIDRKGGDYKNFVDGLKRVMIDLAKMLVRDGEGATKFVEIEIRGAHDKKSAAIIARKVSTSSLLKCCIYGEDPNWGRIAAAAGAGGVAFDPDKADVYIGTMKVFSNGASMKYFDKEKARKVFKKHDIRLTINLKTGKCSATAWTCDFSKEYVAINSEYST